jgi:hypothetical protein
MDIPIIIELDQKLQQRQNEYRLRTAAVNHENYVKSEALSDRQRAWIEQIERQSLERRRYTSSLKLPDNGGYHAILQR